MLGKLRHVNNWIVEKAEDSKIIIYEHSAITLNRGEGVKQFYT